MEPVFVDTSALYALLDADDRFHLHAVTTWKEDLIDGNIALLTSDYVVVESFELVRRRLGLDALAALDEIVEEALHVTSVGEDLRRRATARLFAERRRSVSLVDYTSFEVAAEQGARRAFAYDDHFRQAGFSFVRRFSE